MKLPASQVAVLEAASADEAQTIDQIATMTAEKPETVTGAAFDLESEGLVSIEETVEESVELTDEGRQYLEAGLPEVGLYEAATELGADEDAVSMGQVIGASGLDGAAVDIALSNYARKGYGTIDSGEITADPDADPETDAEAAALEALASGDVADDETLDQLAHRGLVDRSERTVRSVRLSDDGITALIDRKSTRLNSSHRPLSRMPSSA